MVLEHGDKAESTINAEPNEITPRHRALMRKIVGGMKIGEACEDIGMSISRASVVVNSPLFQEEMKRMEADLKEKFVEAEAEKSGDATRILLTDASEKAAKTLKGALDNGNPQVAVSAAKDILDRTGYGKEDKIKANIMVEPSQSLIDVVDRIIAEKRGAKDGEEEV